MAQKEVEVILVRQLASYLATPVFIVDPQGTVIFYNEAAEGVLGLRFEETGEMPASEWATAFVPMDETGAALPPQSLPLMIALTESRPTHRRMRIRGLDGIDREIDLAAFPLIGQAGSLLGAVAVFQEAPQ